MKKEPLYSNQNTTIVNYYYLTIQEREREKRLPVGNGTVL